MCLPFWRKLMQSRLGHPQIEIQLNMAHVSRLSFHFLWLWLYVGSVTYVQRSNVYNHIKAGGLHVWAKKKIVMDS